MASFIKSTLRKDEEIRYEGKISWLSMLTGIFFGVIFLFMGVTAIIGIVLLLRALILYLTTEIAVTSKRVAAKQGFIQRKSIELKLDKVESLKVDQGVLGRLLNYGTITIAGAGINQAGIKGIKDPLRFRSKFLDTQDEFEK